MKKYLIPLLLSVLPLLGWTAGPSIELDKIKTDVTDTASLQRGVQVYMNYCMGCHSLEYGRYNRIARDLKIPEEVFAENLIFTDTAIGSLMTNSMTREDGAAWFGVAPPDLTLVNRVRGSDWMYTYLRGFYQDDSRPFGVNNVAFENVGMPHALLELQGLCAEAPTPVTDRRFDPLTGRLITDGGCESYAIEGSMTPSEFDETIYDLVNFLDYMGEPAQQQRERIGWMVLAFLTVFLIIGQLLYRELWKDIH